MRKLAIRFIGNLPTLVDEPTEEEIDGVRTINLKREPGVTTAIAEIFIVLEPKANGR